MLLCIYFFTNKLKIKSNSLKAIPTRTAIDTNTKIVNGQKRLIIEQPIKAKKKSNSAKIRRLKSHPLLDRSLIVKKQVNKLPKQQYR